nr:iron ABC transporter substrate-binding protein [Petrachloros mirabilis]
MLIACNGQPVVETPNGQADVPAGEQTLVIYSGRNEELIGGILEQFQTDTGISVDVRYGDTAELAATILEEGNNSPADIFFGQDAGALGALQREGRTRSLPESILSRVDPRFRSQEGEWIGITGRARVLDYNTELISNESELPNSVWDLTEPQWQGRVGWAPTNGSFQSFITAMRKIEGDERTLEWLEAMKANDAQVYRNNTAIVEALGRGEVAIGLVNNYYLARFKKEDPNFSVAHHYPQGDIGAMINVAGVAILNTTDAPEAAETFVEYLLQPSSQQFFVEEVSEYPLITGVTQPADQIPLAEINPPNIDLSDLADLEGTLALLNQAGVL